MKFIEVQCGGDCARAMLLGAVGTLVVVLLAAVIATLRMGV